MALFIAGSVTGSTAFVTSKQHVLSHRLSATVATRDDDAIDAPDHMPELREIAPTFDAKTSNTAFAKYKSDYARSLSSNAQYWNERAQSLISWDHYPFEENCDGIVTGGFKHGDIAWFPGGEFAINIWFNLIVKIFNE